MAFWHVTNESPGTGLGMKVKKALQTGADRHDASAIQGDCPLPESASGLSGSSRDVWVLDTEDAGRVLLVDGSPMRAAEAESPYHEMLVHVPVNAHPAPRSVLVIGGSDGAVLELLSSYSSLTDIVAAGVDESIAKASAAWFPGARKAFSDARLRVSGADAASFARDCRERFDVIILDPSDPIAGLAFPQSFFCDCFRLLSGDGVLVCDCGGMEYRQALRETGAAIGKIRRLFPVFRPYRVPGRIVGAQSRLFGFAAKTFDPAVSVPGSLWLDDEAKASWYRPDMHRAAFALPGNVEAMLGTV